MIEPGAMVGRIRIDRVIGRGAMGVVFAGTHLELEQPVAVKVLLDECAAEPVTVARFLREARAAAQLRTEHVCRVFDVGRFDNDAPYMVMELLAGDDLRVVAEREELAAATAVDYIVQACIALGEAHAAGVVHRDLKPANLFRTRGADGRVVIKVLDFGIAKAATAAEAKLTATQSMMGTPAYTSPEQIRSARDVDLRTDIWALGATLYHLATGRLPFMAQRIADMAIRVITTPPDPMPELDPGLAAVLLRCMEKEPERRYASVGELALALAPFGGAGASYSAQLAMPPTRGMDAARSSMPMPAAAPAPAPMQAPMMAVPSTVVPHRAPAPAAKKSNTAVAIGIGVFGVGGLIGLVVALAVSKGDKRTPDTAPPPATTMTAAPPTTAPPPTTTQPPPSAPPPPAAAGHKPTWKVAPARNAPPDPATRRVYETQMAAAEKQLEDHPDYPPAILEANHKSVASDACMLEDGAKAADHLPQLTEASDRDSVVYLCLSYGITLTP